MDIKALEILRKRVRDHKRLESPEAVGDNFEDFKQRVNKTKENSVESIKEIKAYCEKINEALLDLKRTIKDFNIEVTDVITKMLELKLIKAEVMSDVTTGSNLEPLSVVKREMFDMKRALLVKESQKLLQDQQDLLKLINQTEGIIGSIEYDGEVTLEELNSLNANVSKYVEGLETEKERRDRQKKKAEKEEEEERRRKEKEEKERLRKEKEEAQERKRQAEIERMKNPKNWPLHVYSRTHQNSYHYHGGISCLVSAMEGPNGITKQDIFVTESADQEEMLTCLTKGDVLLTDIVTLAASGKTAIDLEIPARIYVPYSPCDEHHTVHMKVRKDKGDWTVVKSTREAPKNFKQDLNIIRMEISKLKSLEIVVVSRPEYQNITITSKGGSFRSIVDSNTVVTVPPGCVDADTQMDLRVKEIPDILLNRKNNDNIRVVTKFHEISLGDKTLKNFKVQMQADDNKTIAGSHMKAIENCKGKLASDINYSVLIKQLTKNGTVSGELVNELEGLQTGSGKVQRLLNYFMTCSSSDFEGLIEGLEDANQGHLAQLIQKKKEEFDNNDSDFEGNLEILTASGESGNWEIVQRNAIQQDGDIINISTQEDKNSLNVVGLVVPKSMLEADIKRAAQKTQEMSIQSPTSLILRQQGHDPHQFCAQCVVPDKVPEAIQSLSERGYTRGPSEPAILGICDGDEITFSTSGNMIFKDKEAIFSKRIFANIYNEEMTLSICEKEKRGKLKQGKYHGQLKYVVGDRDMITKGYFDTYLPVGDDYKRYAPLRMDAELVSAVKCIAIQLQEKTQNVDAFLKDLGKQEYRSLDGRVKREVKDGDVRATIEAFLLNWSARRPKTENKVKVIMDAVQRYYPGIHGSVQSFINIYSPPTGCLSNKRIDEMAGHIAEQWETLGIAMKMTDKVIHDIKTNFHTAHDRAVNILDQWRLSDDAVTKGIHVTQHLKSILERVKCSPQAIDIIKKHI